MEENEYQKELFEFEKPKKRKTFLNLKSLFPKYSVTVILNLERIIFIIIAAILLMVILYAMGVERGKSIGRLASPIAKETQGMPVQATIAPPVSTISPEAVKPQEKEIDKPYTIVAATFIRKDAAQLEANRLKREGLDAFIAQSDSYFLVCIGSYPDKSGAQSKGALVRVRQFHKDAYFKLR